MTTISGVRVRDPPTWREAERVGRVSYLPPRAMGRTYKSELRRRELMAAEAESWRQLRLEVFKRETSEAAFQRLASAFVDYLISHLGSDLATLDGGGLHRTTGNENDRRVTNYGQ